MGPLQKYLAKQQQGLGAGFWGTWNGFVTSQKQLCTGTMLPSMEIDRIPIQSVFLCQL